MSTTASKKYGLILKNSAAPVKLAVKPVAAAFANNDDDDTEATSSSEVTISTMRAKMQARREHEKALAEDPTIFDYDNVYEELQAKKNRKITEVITADKERKSKYAGQILEAHKKRLLAQQSREERKQQKEREAEAGEFDDKEKFVTSAYKKQLAEMENFRLQEAVDSRLDELTAVEKQKSGMWKGGFYRTLLNDISRDNSAVKEELDIKQDVGSPVDVQDKTLDRAEHAKKLASLRKNDSDDRFLEFSGDKPTKLTDFDDSDVEPEMNTEVSVQLKPGLNILKSRVKKPTKAEQIRRHFTPSPEHLVGSGSSGEESSREEKRRIERRERHGKQRREKSVESETVKSAKKHHSKSRQHNPVGKKEQGKCDEKKRVEKEGEQELKKRAVVEKTKEERLQIIKKILAHRNGPEKIEEMRQRYLERRNEKVVSLPL